MRKVLVSRVIALVPTLFIVSLVTFALLHLMPGSPASVILGQDATNGQIAQLNAKLGLNHPLLVQYFVWMGHAVQGQFGNSLITGQSVLSTIGDHLPVTLSLALVGIVFALIEGIGVGIGAAMRPGGKLDQVTQVGASFGLSVPNFWLAMLLVIPFALWTRLFPATGYVAITQNPLQWLHSIALGAFALSLAPAAVLARQTRAALNSVMSQDFVRAARARGMSERRTIFKHGLKNALIPVVTLIGFQFAVLLGGAVVIEAVFGFNGIGQLMISSVQDHDIPVVQGLVVIAALVVIVVNMLVDVIYSSLDPRIRVS